MLRPRSHPAARATFRHSSPAFAFARIVAPAARPDDASEGIFANDASDSNDGKSAHRPHCPHSTKTLRVSPWPPQRSEVGETLRVWYASGQRANDGCDGRDGEIENDRGRPTTVVTVMTVKL
jgi:hypothetical protein